MASAITVFICDDASKAAQARGDLEADGFRVVYEQHGDVVSDDAATYDSGPVRGYADKWVVVGEK